MQQSLTERIAVVDVLRAVALCGIAVTHAEMGFLAGPPPSADFMVFSPIDTAVDRWVDILVESKFFTIFSFLFGLSFAIQIDSARQKNRPFTGRFAWRLTLLFLIGMAHQLVFNGDILMIYAALGLLLIPLARIRSGILLGAALLLVLNVPALVQNLARVHSPPSVAEQQRATDYMREVYGVGGKRLYEANKHGSFLELARTNYTEGLEMKWVFQSSTGRFWITFGCFQLGVCAGRAQLFRDTERNRRFFQATLVGGGTIALATTILPMVYSAGSALSGAWMSFASGVQKATLASFYVAAVTLAFWARPHGWLAALAPLGKMGLTTYLLQSLVLAVICCGFGLGLMGDFGSAAGAAIGLALFIAQIFLARWWMSRYSMGPVEWLWRTATWMKRQPLGQPAPA